jgi:ankyrin repeat protein
LASLSEPPTTFNPFLGRTNMTQPRATTQSLNNVEPSRFEDVSSNKSLEEPASNSLTIAATQSSSSPAVHTSGWLTDLNQGSKTKPCATIPSPNDVEQSQLEHMSENQTTEDSLRNSLATNATQNSPTPHVFTTKWLTAEAKRRKVFDKDPREILLQSAAQGDEILARICLSLKHISPNMKDSLGTPVLVEAARRGHLGVVELLLESGATVDVEGEEGIIALNCAAYNGHEAVVRVLAEKGATINQQSEQGVTALYLAAQNGHEAVVRVLAEKGATINQQTEDGWTALHLAAQNGHEAVVRVVAEKGATINQQTKDGWTALHWAAVNGHEAVVRVLAGEGATINQQTKDGWTALHLAASNSHEAVVRVLVAHHADIRLRINRGDTARSVAKLHGHTAIAEFLKSKGG